MTYSSKGRYRDSPGTLTVGGGKLVFTRTDGLITRTERVVATIPTDAIVSVRVEGLVGKKLIVLVDGTRIPGIPRHEFQVPDPHVWRRAILKEMSVRRQAERGTSEPIKEVHVKEITREVVKISCRYCHSLNEMTAKKCWSCGAPLR